MICLKNVILVSELSEDIWLVKNKSNINSSDYAA